MKVTHKGVNYKSLAEMAGKVRHDKDFLGTFREKGVGILDNAVDVFFKSDREVEDARMAIEDLKDLERAMKACKVKTDKTRESNQGKAREKMGVIKETGEGLRGPEEEKLNNVESFSKRGHIIKDGRRVYGEEKVKGLSRGGWLSVKPDGMKGVLNFIKDLHEVLPLYTCVTMVPGPMSVTVKNFAKETMKMKSKETGHSESHSASSGTAVGLLPLGAAVYDSASSDISEINKSSNMFFQKVTTDERIIPTLMDLRTRMEEMETKDSTTGEILAESRAMEYETVLRKKKGLFTNKKSYERSSCNRASQRR